MNYTALVVVLACGVGCSQGNTDDASMSIPEPPDMARISNEELTRAVQEARAAVGSNPESAEAWARLGHVYQAHEWEESAVQCYRRASEIEPQSYQWLYYLGRSLRTSDPDAALEALSRAIELNDRYAPLHLHQAHVLRSLKEFDEAKRALERVEQLEPGNAFSALGLGELALAEGDIETAQFHLRIALTRNPGQSATHAALAKVYMASGDRELAREHATAATQPSSNESIRDPLWHQVEMSGVTPKWRIYQGRLALREGDFETAAERLASAISPDEADPKLWLDYGAALLGAGDYPRAIELLQKALAIVDGDSDDAAGAGIPVGDHAMLYNNLGLAHENTKQYEIAEEHLRRAVDISAPDSVQRSLATSNLIAFLVRTGAAHEQSKELEQAERYFSQALELEPGSALLLNNLAVVYRGQGRYRDAIDVVQRSLKIQEDPRIRRMLEILSAEAGIPQS